MAGFRVNWVNENNPRFIEHYKHGYKSWRVASGNSSRLPYIEARSIEKITARMVNRSGFPNGRPPIFGIIGGPPCPDFCNGGLHAGKSGENGRLSQYYVNLVCDLEATFFVLENVAGLVRFKRHREHLYELVGQLSDSGYLTDYMVLNALEFGVPQYRERVFLIGFRRKQLNGCLRDIGNHTGGWFQWPVVRKYQNAQSRYPWPTSNPFRTTPRKPKGIPSQLCVGSYLVPMNKQTEVPNATCYFNSYSKKFYEVAEGNTSGKSFKRLHRYRYSPTACYGNNEVHLHPSEPRRLSLRETMRIQGIPDSYILPEDATLSSAFKLVSNGVPVPLALHVAKSIHKMLKSSVF